MKTTIQKLHIPTGHRILCISDIHGEYDFLVKGLEAVGFCEDDILFIDGDLIEKGPESLKTLRYVMKLTEGGNVHVIMGNNDAYKLDILQLDSEWADNTFLKEVGDCIRRNRPSILLDMMQEAGIAMPDEGNVSEVRRGLCHIYKKELDFIRALPTIIETQSLVFIHGGAPSLDFEKLAQHDAYEFMKNDAFMDQGVSFDRYVVLGHWPVLLYCSDPEKKRPLKLSPMIDRERKIINIDGGLSLKDSAQLNVLILPDIESEDFSHVGFDFFKEVRALDFQKESEQFINITWVNRQVEIVDKGEEFTKVRHLATGTVLDVRTACLYTWLDEQCCDDYTDYELPIQPGDTIKIMETTSRGYCVKKDGVIGWYRGRYEEIE